MIRGAAPSGTRLPGLWGERCRGTGGVFYAPEPDSPMGSCLIEIKLVWTAAGAVSAPRASRRAGVEVGLRGFGSARPWASRSVLGPSWASPPLPRGPTRCRVSLQVAPGDLVL